MLQPSSQSISSILESIKTKTAMIDRMAICANLTFNNSRSIFSETPDAVAFDV